MTKYDSKFALISLLIRTFTTHLPTLLHNRISTLIHKLTYHPLPPSNCKNVLILGASFSGTALASRLSDTLPTGYRVILLEKNSHFNYSFVFPRFSVFAGKGEGEEGKAFIPYEGLGKGKPRGVFKFIRGKATSIDLSNKKVILENGEGINFEYLAIATGCSQPFPARMKGCEKSEGVEELRGMQGRIERSGRIAVVGGGAVGVQLVGDIKSWFPEKEVVLVHSRERLMSGFGERLGGYVREKLEGMGVVVRVGERVVVPEMGEGENENEKGVKIRWKDGGEEVFDLVIPCTGQTPNSSLLPPTLLSPLSSRVSVLPTLQLPSHSNIFALGDVADTPGPKMARAGMKQAEIVVSNILSLIKKEKGATNVNLKEYVPNCVEGALKLSLGRYESVMYVKESEERDILVPMKSKSDDLDVGRAWAHFGVGGRNFSA